MTMLLERSIKLRVSFTVLIIAIACAFCGYIEYSPSFAEPVNLNTLEPKNYKKGLVVEGTFNFAFGPFYEEYYVDEDNNKSDFTYYYMLTDNESGMLYTAAAKGNSFLNQRIRRAAGIDPTQSNMSVTSDISGRIKETPDVVTKAQKEAFFDPSLDNLYPEDFFETHVIPFMIEPYDPTIAMYLTYGGLIATFISMLMTFSFYGSAKKQYDYEISRETIVKQNSHNRLAGASSQDDHSRNRSRVNAQDDVSLFDRTANSPSQVTGSSNQEPPIVTLEKRKGEIGVSERTLASLEAQKQSNLLSSADIDGDGAFDDISSYFVDDVDYNADIQHENDLLHTKSIHEKNQEIAKLKEPDIKNDFKDFFAD